MMIGRDELRIAKRSNAASGKGVLTVRGLKVHDDRGHQAIKDLSFDLHQNEILGIAGVDGNGQTELSQALVGLRAPSAGSVRLDDKELAGRSPAEIISRRSRVCVRRSADLGAFSGSQHRRESHRRPSLVASLWPKRLFASQSDRQRGRKHRAVFRHPASQSGNFASVFFPAATSKKSSLGVLLPGNPASSS